ncbi:Protein serine/threonine kinase [Entamoeba marina]
MFSSYEINSKNYDGLINKCNGRLKRFCFGEIENNVFCEFNGTSWLSEFTIDSNPFNYYHCMDNCGGDDCFIKSLTSEPILVENNSINATFIDNNVILIISDSTNYISINYVEIELFALTKSNMYLNSINKMLKQTTEYTIATTYLIPYSIDTIFIFDNMKCGYGYIDENNVTCLILYGCSHGYYRYNDQCNECPINCKTCNSTSNCYLCEDGYYLENGSCLEQSQINCFFASNNYCLVCEDGYFLNDTQCSKCEENCISCNFGICYYCNNTFNNNGECQTILNTEVITNYSILQCSNNYFNNEGESCELCNSLHSNCNKCNHGICLECSNGYILNNSNLCESMNCINSSTTMYGYCNECDTLNGYMMDENGNCVIEINECINGYYLNNNNLCYECPNECTTCHNLTYCFECNDGYMLNDNNECVDISESNANCKTAIPGSIGGCAICNDGYYREQTTCLECISNCTKCNNGESFDNKCIDYQLIDNCKESSDSKCTSCSFWHTLNSDQTGCDKQVVWWVIVLIVLFILIVLIGICVLIWYLIKQLFKTVLTQQEKNANIFNIKKSSIVFNKTSILNIVSNKDTLLFNEKEQEIPVNEETRDLLCVGNTSKHTIKVQFSVKECDKYEIRTNPQIIALKKGKACEFEISIKPLCTCSINEQIMLIASNLKNDKTSSASVTIKTITVITTRLDYSELIEEDKLGEGGFGIVYKGMFRGNQVAIKKMKDAQDNIDAIEEFNKEVSMLDKFRSDYIVHFYGAVFIPHKICMVTEFAQYGSLKDLMNKRKKEPINNAMKIKILLDCSKGISYLHSNGILHRDVKPDNFLLLTLNTDEKVNAKLTDFGSSRNINMLMTNMTFTKGIGTPVYMAPEILDRKKYKKAADIYSFAITIYELLKWDEVYPLSEFKFPWSIAEFVTEGKRLAKLDIMNDSIYSLIDNCWKQDPKERCDISQIIETFSGLS